MSSQYSEMTNPTTKVDEQNPPSYDQYQQQPSPLSQQQQQQTYVLERPIIQGIIRTQNRPDDYLVLSIMNAFCCLFGCIPLIFSLKSRDRFYLGDYDGARVAGRRARLLNLICILLSVSVVMIYLAFSIMHTLNRYNKQDNFPYNFHQIKSSNMHNMNLNINDNIQNPN